MKLLTVILFLSVNVENSRAWVDYYLVPTNVWVEFVNESLVSNVSIVINKYNRTTTTLSYSFTTLHAMEDNVQWVYHVAEGLSGGFRDTSILDATMDICKNPNEMTKQNRLMFELVTTLMKNWGNLPMSCPVLPGHYYVNDFFPDDQLYPPYVPGNKWRIDVSLIHNGTMLFKMVSVVLVDRTQKLRESLIRKMG